jgi:hypothetical protein
MLEPGRCKFFELADLRKAPLAVEAVRRIDAIFAIEREINGFAAAQRLAARQKWIKPLVDELKACPNWLGHKLGDIPGGEIRFAPDSPLEGTGFEISVPLEDCG